MRRRRRRGVHSSIASIGFLLIVLVALFALSRSSFKINLPGNLAGTATSAPSGPTKGEPHWGVQTKTSGCQVHGALQDTACTPGDIFPTATKDVICKSGYASSVRN